ncbi:hypothetical protein HF086_012580, partial [Spodoptera exigua]
MHSWVQIWSLFSGGECSLRAFLSDYVQTGESERLAAAARAQIDDIMRASSAWREKGAPPATALKSGTRHSMIFSCSGAAWRVVADTARAARRCAACGGSAALRATSAALGALSAHCRATHCRMCPTSSTQ